MRHGTARITLLVLLTCLVWWVRPPFSDAQPFTFTQITNTPGGANRSPRINAAGSRIVFASALNPTGGNANGNLEIFLFDTTTGLTQITNTIGRRSADPSINAAGTRIAFESEANLTGGNPDGNFEIFLFDTTTGFTQITNTTGGSFANMIPSINAAGTRIAFESNRNLTGGNPDGNREIFLFDTTTGFAQVTNTTAGASISPSINAAGTRIAFASQANLTGGNPDGNLEIFLFDTTTGFTQMTNTTGGTFANLDPSIDAAGTRLAFVSDRNLTGGNPDGNLEIFRFDTTTGLTQITNTTGGPFVTNFAPSINATGTRIAFASTRDLTAGAPGNADGNNEIFLFDITTGFTQVTNTTGGINGNSNPRVNSDGTRIAFLSDRNLTPGSPGNSDGSAEVFLATSTTPETTVAAITAFVTRLYQTVLLREPDAPGLAAHVADIQAFGTVIPTVLAFFHSAEFLSQPLTDDQFLDRLYHTFLNRAPDPAGLQAFQALLASGCRTRDTLIAALTFSDEFTSLVPPLPVADLRIPFVAELYAWILNRPPDPALQGWVTQLQRSTALATVLSFLHSPEFQTPRRDTATYVNSLYLAFLGRPPDCGGLTFWVTTLTQQGDTDAARDQVAGQFAASQEFQNKLNLLFP